MKLGCYGIPGSLYFFKAKQVMIEFDVKIDETDYLNRKSEIWAGKKIIHRGKAAHKTD